MKDFLFLINDNEILSKLNANEDMLEIIIGKNNFVIRQIDENKFETETNGELKKGVVVYHKGKYFVDIDSHQFELENGDELSFASATSTVTGDKDKIFAPMPGKIVKLMVKVGDSVKEKMPVVIVEAMKMENQVLAMADGVVKSIHFAVGDQVDTMVPIIELDLDEKEDTKK